MWVSPAAALSNEQKLIAQAWRIVNRSYVDSSFNGENWWFVRQKALKQPLRTREDAYDAIDNMLDRLDDPFTRLLRPDRYRTLQVTTSGELTGVGLQIAIDEETRDLKVVAPIAGSPADEAGVQPQDRILKIDGISTQDLSLEDAATRMRGPIGTRVTLTVEHAETEEIEDIRLKRDRIAINPVSTQLDRSVTPPVGYIRLNQFNANAIAATQNAIARLEQQGADRYILDLRSNPGGLFQAGIGIARLWLDEGTIVYTVNRQGVFGSFDATRNAITSDPLAVLVNRGTASASEILAGALQDNDRATIIGERTFGKGLIQSVFDLEDGAGLAVTVAKYETPNHTDINKHGIEPDLVVEQKPIQRDRIGTPDDLQYQAAIDTLTDNTAIADAA
jgi:carboxyl-terminal processing protease